MKLKWMPVVFILHFYQIPTAKTEEIKIWNMNTNFLNARNWEHDQLPCENDRIIFPATSPVITFMPESFAASELILPVNGELIFPDKAVLELTGGKRPGTCKGKDVYFKISVDYWFEPTNWNITSNAAFPRITNRRNAAVPHAFQVPCWMDTVRFPPGETFRTHLDYPLTSISALEINNVAYSQQEFDDLIQTRVGSLIFPNNPTIRITSNRCKDESGCICGNDGPALLPTICMFMTPLCEPTLECSDPIQPVGHCCPICGAKIVLEHDERFKMEKMLNLHASFLTKREYESIESFTSKTNDGKVQSIFVDSAKSKGLANRVAQRIYTALQLDMKGPRLYRVRSIDIQKSEKWSKGVPTYDNYASGMSSGGIAALVIVLMAIVGLGVVFYIYKKRNISGFNFARFDLRGDKIELELGTTPHDELEPDDNPPVPGTSGEDGSKGFDNPVYGTSVEEVSPVLEETSEVKDFVENPMFMIFEDMPSDS